MTTTPSSTDPALLEVHLLGGSKGESIVLKLPDDQWGVVDCYTDAVAEPDKNPTIQFLHSRGVKKLLFVCLTHAHDDHFLGMVKLIETFAPAQFWRFGCLAPPHISKLMQYNKLRAREVDGAKRAELTRSMKELFDVLKIAEKGQIETVFITPPEGIVNRRFKDNRVSEPTRLSPNRGQEAVPFISHRPRSLVPVGLDRQLIECPMVAKFALLTSNSREQELRFSSSHRKGETTVRQEHSASTASEQ